MTYVMTFKAAPVAGVTGCGSGSFFDARFEIHVAAKRSGPSHFMVSDH